MLLGISIAQMLVYEGIRGSSDRMYLRPNKHRPNLRVAINSHVTKVSLIFLIKKENIKY